MKDSYNREITYLRISVTDHCNLRCRYCMPADGGLKLGNDALMSVEEIDHAVHAAVAVGIRKLRITGGEPLVRSGILEICRNASQTEGIQELCMTTNGVLLPKLAKELREAGVSRLNISLDTLDPEKFSYISRVGELSNVLDGIEAALAAGFEKIKLNAVLIGGYNDNEIPALAELTRKWPVDMRFIEMMPMYDSGDFHESAFIPCSTVTDALPELEPVPQDGSVARLYRLPGAQGNIGLISPVSAHFCAECNRLRLTADGKLRPCLHSCEEYSIKGLDREGMVEQFKAAIVAKPRWHGELSYTHRSGAEKNMNEIGG